MKALGLIVEYNPLHNGHVHHITASKEKVKPDVTIAVMSGHFMQRGEPACTTKWMRAKFALENGIDLVVELPYAYSNQAADLFAIGAVSILKHLGATHIVFGSELGSIDDLTELAQLMETRDFQESVKGGLAKGLSVPRAYVQANPALTGSNNTLGIQYIRAIKKLDANIIPLTIKRHASNYNDQQPTHDKITSATAIRNMIDENIDYSSYVPQKINDDYVQLQNWEYHYKFLRHKLLTTASEELEKIHDMIEGIENRLISSAMKSSTFAEFLESVATKRYTNTRIQRICANVLTGTLKKDIASWDLPGGASYVRVLGFNKEGSDYLRHIKKETEVPIYSNFGKDVHSMLAHEKKVVAAYVSVYDSQYASEIIKKEYAGRPVIRN